MSKKKKPQIKKKHTNKLMRTVNDPVWTIAIAGESILCENDALGLYPEDYNQNNTPLQTTLQKIYKPANNIENYAEKVRNVKNILTDIFDKYLASLSDMDKTLNKYSCRNEIDSFDFRQYVKENDILDEMREIIDKDGDTAILFSSSEFFDIKFTNTVSWRVQRIMYDHLNDGVRYCIIEYRKTKLFDDCVLEIPTAAFVVQYDIVNIINNEECIKTDAYSQKTVDFSRYIKTSTLTEKNADYLKNNNSDPNDYKAIRIGVMGFNNLHNIKNWLSDNHDEMVRSTYRFAKDLFDDLIKEQYCCVMPQQKIETPTALQARNKYIHINLTESLPIAAIVVANHLLKQKKLSRPISANQSETKYGVEITLENKPARKTRMLGDCIRISTEKRPENINEEKLIKYHTPEWERKSHLRHLKSGKIIEIKSQKCKRRCVDMSDIKTKQTAPAIDYIINPSKENPTEE